MDFVFVEIDRRTTCKFTLSAAHCQQVTMAMVIAGILLQNLHVATRSQPICEGAEVVFHMAAPDSSINNYKLHHSVNVQAYELPEHTDF
ncbi:3beta-hydroxysteroid-dehydrogenase/decarboxylase isoform 2 [Artemisia annua]|uniref:3beta-hydroxysteroid-dehydrogenase/decarboxylase isoform 2 n=1 Tax=Artemisia annua TaxID=35608 RepID=A0A2U1M6K4_ARTAN|nr:3beta-hydroxysteroid-dehydrogenase/decarboxylase isoform 2 [Artemisia annua]